jgi:electron transfer flavoprotein alpha/beta subunit
VSNEVGEPRYPTIKGIMAAKKIEPTIWKPAAISAPRRLAALGVISANSTSRFHEAKCEYAGGRDSGRSGGRSGGDAQERQGALERQRN